MTEKVSATPLKCSKTAEIFRTSEVIKDMDAKTPSDATPATNPAEIGSKSVETPAVIAPAEDGVLPKLPPPQKECWIGHQLFSADQMHAMYRQGIAHAQRSSVDGWPAGVLNKADTLAILTQHNAWRRGAEGPQTDPRMLGLALDATIAALREQGGHDGR